MSRSRLLSLTISLIVALTILDGASSYRATSISPNNNYLAVGYRDARRPAPASSSALRIFKTDDKDTADATAIGTTAEETTKKFGLEAGLFQSLKSKDADSAKSLLAKYGIAYLATSIPLALVSFLLCYALVDNGVDVGGILSKIGIDAGDNGERAGTFAIAYAAHKAASPIRFPPTVLLTPIVAKIIGKEPNVDDDDDDGMNE
ncbi:hypothetical protein ACHAXA_010974 [Cyclostephanos tholiformis]|uniref:DUF1279 domain-containing protein n=1 Tax=Cyclostephanos tholiformis TaxID=382380 RepID=A0ABD3RZT9_9STRA